MEVTGHTANNSSPTNSGELTGDKSKGTNSPKAEGVESNRWEVRFDPQNLNQSLARVAALERGREDPFHRKVLHPDLPQYSDILPCAQFLEKHPYKDILLQKNTIPHPSSYETFLRFPRFILKGIGEAIPASPFQTHPDESKDYNLHEWGRDLRWSLLVLKWLGQIDRIEQAGTGILKFYASPDQYKILLHFHFKHNNPHWNYSQGHAGQPFIRVPIDENNGVLRDVVHRKSGQDNGYSWGHDQPGTFGELLWEFFRLGNDGLIDLEKINRAVAKGVDLQYRTGNPLREESIFATMLTMLHRISICENEHGHRRFQLWTKGPWEEEKAENRLSEITPIYAATLEMRKFLEKPGSGRSVGLNDSHGRLSAFRRDLDELCILADRAFNDRLPRRSTEMAKETDTEMPRVKQYDSAVAFTLWPYELDLTKEQKIAILKTVYHLMKRDDYKGPGTIRYEGDPYCGSLLDTKSDGNWNVDFTDQKDPREQQWFLPDPVLGLFFAREASEKFQNLTEVKLGFQLMRYANQHAMRSNSQIPFQDEEYTIFPTDGSKPYDVKVPAGVHREGAWLDGRGKWRMGPNSLHWTAALNTMCNFRMMRVTEQAWKIVKEREGGVAEFGL